MSKSVPTSLLVLLFPLLPLSSLFLLLLYTSFYISCYISCLFCNFFSSAFPPPSHCWFPRPTLEGKTALLSLNFFPPPTQPPLHHLQFFIATLLSQASFAQTVILKLYPLLCWSAGWQWQQIIIRSNSCAHWTQQYSHTIFFTRKKKLSERHSMYTVQPTKYTITKLQFVFQITQLSISRRKKMSIFLLHTMLRQSALHVGAPFYWGLSKSWEGERGDLALQSQIYIHRQFWNQIQLNCI